MADLTRNPDAGPLTGRDFAALAHDVSEPGPQHSKASPAAHRFADAFVYTLGAIAVVAVFVHAYWSLT